MDGVLLHEVERAFVSYSVDGKRVGGHVEAPELKSLSPSEQDNFVQEMKAAQTPVYYDTQGNLPPQNVLPVYPMAEVIAPTALASAVLTAVPIEAPITIPNPPDEEKLQEAFLDISQSGASQKSAALDMKDLLEQINLK